MVEDDGRPTPPVVTCAVSIGTAPLPFLAVYAALFLLHGAVHPVHPPDITRTQHGELIAGLITLVLFIAAIATLVQFLNRRRRWPFAILELAVLGACLDFVVDPTKGGRTISVLLIITTLVALFLGFAPECWTHVGRRCPGWLTSLYARIGLGGDAGAAPARPVRSGVTTSPAEPDRPDDTPPVTASLPTSTPSSEPEPAGLRRRRFPRGG